MASTTTDHGVIRRWVEQRGGVPATVQRTCQDGSLGILRIDFPDSEGDDSGLTTVSWNEFFDKFDEAELAFLHENETYDGKDSRFCKFVSRS